VESEGRWVIEDSYAPKQKDARTEFTVRWQFAPASWVKRMGGRAFAVHRGDAAITVEVDENWEGVELVEPVPPDEAQAGVGTRSFEGIVSPAFREICRAPFLKLTARVGDKPCVFRTTFLASPHS
jgi:hypothetical protein